MDFSLSTPALRCPDGPRRASLGSTARTLAATGDPFGAMRAVLDGIRAEAGRRGSRLVVVLLPVRPAYDAARHGVIEPSRRQAALVGMLDELGIETWDATGIFEELGRDPSDPALYVRDAPDEHFSPEGHALYADWLRPRIRVALGR